MTAIRSYRDLHVWQKAMQLVTDVYRATSTFPKEEAYGLTAQIRRAAVSIPSNIAEGHSRHTRKEYTRFLHIANGSIAEIETQILIARNLLFLDDSSSDSLLGCCTELGRMLSGLLKKLEHTPITPEPSSLNPDPLLYDA